MRGFGDVGRTSSKKKIQPVDNIARLRAERDALEAENRKCKEQCFEAGKRWAEQASWGALVRLHDHKHLADSAPHFYAGAMTIYKAVMNDNNEKKKTYYST
jgi:hypothetical protein